MTLIEKKQKLIFEERTKTLAGLIFYEKMTNDSQTRDCYKQISRIIKNSGLTALEIKGMLENLTLEF